MTNIQKITKNLKKELKKDVTIPRLEEALLKRGFSLLFTDTDDGKEQLEHLGLTEYSKRKKAFTVCSAVKFVFVDGGCHKNDIVKLILHELAHIELKHIGYTDCFIHDEITAEIEADAVVYNLLENKKKNYVFISALACGLIVFLCLFILFFNRASSTSGEVSNEHQTQQTYEVEGQPVFVYITPTGHKFHRQTCIYAASNNAIAVLRSEAEANYDPCKVCNP